MKLKKIFSILAGLFVITGCDGEKDLIIIDADLPIKTSTLFMVGDATPNGWSIDAPTPLVPSEDDPLVFTWEGQLNIGEMKLCLTTGSWDSPFIRPLNSGDEIGKAGVPETMFQMHAGDPDEKWKIVDAGKYSLYFNLRNWTMSANYLGEVEAPEIEPIATDELFIVGDATPNSWNIDDPTPLEKKSEYIFVYEGELNVGEIKACITTGSWDVPFIRPTFDGCKINSNGVEDPSFQYCNAPDHKWKVEDPGIYRLTFDLENWTIAAEKTGEFTPAPKLYMIGEATDGGWGWDAATVIDATPDNDKIFVWTGELGRGTFKAAAVKDYSAPFYRPAMPNCEVSATGVASHEMIFTENPDDQWLVTEAGKYRLTFDTEAMTFDAAYIDAESEEIPTLYMIGSATAGGWSLDKATEITTDTRNIYTWEGILDEGELKACFTLDFSASFYRPATSDCRISEAGVSSKGMVFTTDPDDKWLVTKAGKYRLTFNLNEMQFDAVFVEEANIQVNLYMIGTATSGGWSLDDATEYTAVKDKDGEYTWTGTLKVGTFKACTVKDFTAPFYRPSTSDCTISENGISATDVVYTTDPDDQWNVVTEGVYEITINIKSMTISTKYIN